MKKNQLNNTLSRALVIALTIGLHHGYLSAQPAGSISAGETPAGGAPRPSDILPKLPQKTTPAAPIEVPDKAVAKEWVKFLR